MSRVADALRRRGGTAPPDAAGDDSHPWVFPVEGVSRPQPTGQGIVLPRQGGVAGADSRFGLSARTWARETTPERYPHGEAVPADEGDEQMRRRLSALVQQIFLRPDPPACTGFMPIGLCTAAAALTATAARMVAEQGDSTVCAIDLDPTTPRLHQTFDIPSTPGVADRQLTGASLIKSAREVQSQLWVVPAGQAPNGLAGPARVTASDLESLRAAFDILVMTLEPHSGAEAVPLVGAVDAVILVIDADSTRRDTARRVTDMLHRSGTHVVGAVLVNRRYPIPDAVYRRL